MHVLTIIEFSRPQPLVSSLLGRMPRPRLRPGIAACASAWRAPLAVQVPTRKSSRALISTSTASIEFDPDPPYPAFGFFSRSLPTASLSTQSTSQADTIVDPVTGIHELRNKSAASTSSTWRRGFRTSTPSRCICGTSRIPCLRCRTVSTSAVPKSVPFEEKEPIPRAFEDSRESHETTSSPSPVLSSQIQDDLIRDDHSTNPSSKRERTSCKDQFCRALTSSSLILVPL